MQKKTCRKNVFQHISGEIIRLHLKYHISSEVSRNSLWFPTSEFDGFHNFTIHKNPGRFFADLAQSPAYKFSKMSLHLGENPLEIF